MYVCMYVCMYVYNYACMSSSNILAGTIHRCIAVMRARDDYSTASLPCAREHSLFAISASYRTLYNYNCAHACMHTCLVERRRVLVYYGDGLQPLL